MLEREQELFTKYVFDYDMNNQNISRKYFHSFRVMNHCIEIARSLKLNSEQIKIAGLIGLLHDIGRFKQYTEYHTFSDIKSIDHAHAGVLLLKENNYIEQYISSNTWKEIILNAIEMHNKLTIQNDLDKDSILFSKIIRDADKIDILQSMKIIVNKNETYNKELLNNIYKQTLCVDSNVYSSVDHIVRGLCFIYDLNFEYSYDYILKKNIINDKLGQLSKYLNKDINIDEIKKIMNDYMKYKLLNIKEMKDDNKNKCKQL